MGAEAEAAPAPAEAPAPEQPAAAEPKSREPVNRRNFAQRLQELGYNKADDEPKAEAAEPEAEADKPEPKPKVVDVDPELEQLKTLAAKKGYTIDGEKVSLEEYQKFREHKRKWHESTQKQLQEEREKLETERKELLGEVEWAKQVKAARASGDLDKLAQLHGWKDYADQQQEAINRFADPNYARLRELERTVKEREEAEKKQREEAEQRQQLEQRNQTIRTYIDGLKTTMASSKDPVIQAFSDNDEFAGAIYQIQCEHWDGTTTVTPEQALGIAARGASRTVRENLKAQYERLTKAFGAPEPKPKAVIPPKTKTAPTARAEASTRGPFASKEQERKNILERLSQAMDEDRRAGRI